MRSEEEIERQLTYYAVIIGSDTPYSRGVVDTLKWVLQ